VIYTVTLNPAIDRTLEVEHLTLDEVNRIDTESRYAGGKGIDVSRALKRLGWESVALGFIGGYGGHEVAGRLAEEGVICRFTPIADETRTNIFVHNLKSGEVTSLNARGPEIAIIIFGIISPIIFFFSSAVMPGQHSSITFSIMPLCVSSLARRPAPCSDAMAGNDHREDKAHAQPIASMANGRGDERPRTLRRSNPKEAPTKCRKISEPWQECCCQPP